MQIASALHARPACILRDAMDFLFSNFEMWNTQPVKMGGIPLDTSCLRYFSHRSVSCVIDSTAEKLTILQLINARTVRYMRLYVHLFVYRACYLFDPVFAANN